MIVERRDQVLITFFSNFLFMVSMVLARLLSTKAPLLTHLTIEYSPENPPYQGGRRGVSFGFPVPCSQHDIPLHPLRRGNNFHSWWCRGAAWMAPLNSSK